jgi:hypothetical protein
LGRGTLLVLRRFLNGDLHFRQCLENALRQEGLGKPIPAWPVRLLRRRQSLPFLKGSAEARREAINGFLLGCACRQGIWPIALDPAALHRRAARLLVERMEELEMEELGEIRAMASKDSYSFRLWRRGFLERGLETVEKEERCSRHPDYIEGIVDGCIYSGGCTTPSLHPRVMEFLLPRIGLAYLQERILIPHEKKRLVQHIIGRLKEWRADYALGFMRGSGSLSSSDDYPDDDLFLKLCRYLREGGHEGIAEKIEEDRRQFWREDD